MKKLLSLILAIVLVCAVAGCALADDNIKLETKLTDGMDYTAAKWFDTSLNRATLTWMLIIDYMVAGNDIDEIALTEDSYVSRSADDVLMVIVKTVNKGQIAFGYKPGNGFAMYNKADIYSSAMIEAALEETVGSGNFYKNSLTDLMSVGEMITSAINS